MTSITEPVTPTIIAHVDRLARRRNRILIALAVIVGAVLVAVVVYVGVLIYSAAADSRNAARQTVGLQQQNRDLGRQNQSLLEQVKADDAILKAATSPAAQAAQQAQTAAAVKLLIVCIENHADVIAHLAAPLPDCPGAAPPTIAPANAAPAAVPHPAAAQPQPNPPAPVRPMSPTTTIPTAAGCGPALTYLAAHAAPFFDFTCAPRASEVACAGLSVDGGRAVGCTVAQGHSVGPITGHIYLDSTICPAGLMTAAMNEASNSMRLSGRSTAPVDPYGPSVCPR